MHVKRVKSLLQSPVIAEGFESEIERRMITG